VGRYPGKMILFYMVASIMSELSLRKYGYKVDSPKERRLYSLYLACLDYEKKVVMERMKRLGSFHPVMIEDCEEYFGKKLMTESVVEDNVAEDNVVEHGVVEDSDPKIEIDDVQDACKIFCDLCSIIDETKAVSFIENAIFFIEDAILCITRELRIEDEKWKNFKDDFYAKRDKMVSEFNDFEKCMEVLVGDWNGESWFYDFLNDDFFKKSKENFEKTIKITKNIELQNKKLKGRELYKLTSSKEIFEVRYLRTEMKLMCEELFRVFPVARFFNILKHAAI
jgi:hypothetical protein